MKPQPKNLVAWVKELLGFCALGVLVFIAVISSLSHFSPISFGSLDAMVTQSVLLGGVADNSRPSISECAASVSSTSFCANILGDTFLVFCAPNDKTQITAPQLSKASGVQMRVKRDA